MELICPLLLADIGYTKDEKMKQIFIPFIAVFSNLALAVSLGDTLDNKNAAQTNSTSSVIKVVAANNKSTTFSETSSHGQTSFLVNNNTHKVYSMTWKDKQGSNLKELLGNTYYSQFQIAAKNPKQHIPLRGISIDNGNLVVSQFGSMASGVYGTAMVRNLAP